MGLFPAAQIGGSRWRLSDYFREFNYLIILGSISVLGWLYVCVVLGKGSFIKGGEIKEKRIYTWVEGEDGLASVCE